MASWGNCDYNQFLKFQKRLQALQKKEMHEFCVNVSKELAARLLGMVIKRTPVGQYLKSSRKLGGTLRRGWTARTEAQAVEGGTPNAKEYANSLPVNKTAEGYEIEIINPMGYASYVEYGHRTRNHQGWIKGRFMLTRSEALLKKDLPGILEIKLAKYLGGYLDG